jgi:hypothetical protein
MRGNGTLGFWCRVKPKARWFDQNKGPHAAAMSMGLIRVKVRPQFCLLKCLVNNIQKAYILGKVPSSDYTEKKSGASLYAQVLLRHNIVRGEGKKPSKTAFFKLLNRYSVQIEKGPPIDNDGCPFQKWKGRAFDTHARCASLST